MLKNIFKVKPLVDDNTRQWIFDTFSWAIEHFNIQVFQQETRLVLPTNDYYPGRVASVEEMAKNIFDHTLNYAGMKNWPFELISPHQTISLELPLLKVNNALRGEKAEIAIADEQQSIPLTFNPAQINQPQDLIASYAQQLATVLVLQQKVLPPGGKDLIPQAIDVLACVMGFGVIFANTAYQFKGGCGSCYNPKANRQAALPEHEMLYCLAVFNHLKNIDNKHVIPHLKSHLRGEYKKMKKEVSRFSPSQPTLQILAVN
ncbi:hypothetical protein AADZ91_17145 [Colwelliaceae bacterium 6441]